MNLDIEPIFSSFVYHDYLDIDLEELEKSCKDVFYNSSDSEVGRLNFNDPRFNQLLVEVDKRIQYLHKQFGFKDHLIQKFTDGWVTINKNAYADSAHCHPQNNFSAIFYVKADEKSDVLELINPNPTVLWMDRIPGAVSKIGNYNQFSSSTWEVTPEPGKLVIFPSWVFHQKIPMCDASEVNNDRIAVVFDTVADVL